ncbi:MAG TPA: PEP-CTERM sorting domain-containing protein [Tepidisphaeraceae bacterium]|jgi:hypothetical protein|nr:PEP-CTERM sorting domain-containing protein [Tepidisphaeraceae bacterium]
MGQVTVTAPADARVVVGHDPNPIFVVNNAGAATSFDATANPALPIDFAQGITVTSGNPSVNAVILANSSGNLIVNTPALSGTAGSTYTVGVALTPQGGAVQNHDVAYSLVNNRPLTGSGTYNVGRHMANQSIGSLTLNGGPLTGGLGTNVTVNGGGYASVDGFTLTNASDFTFNDANQSHAIAVQRSQLGSYSTTVTLPTTNAHINNPSNVRTADFGGYNNVNGHRQSPLISVERIGGADVDLSGVSFTASGTALADRLLSPSTAILQVGRVMKDQVGTLDVNTAEVITSNYSDDAHTRLKLNAFDVTQSGVNAKLTDAVTFNGSAVQANVAFTGTINVDNTTIGAKTNTFQLGSNIESVENLAGEVKQTDLQVAVKYNVLANNEVAGRNAIIYTYGGSFVGQTFVNGSVGRKFDTETHTNITVEQQFTATGNSGTVNLTDAPNGGIAGEGLSGEAVQASHSYDWTTKSVARAAVGGTPAGTKLVAGDTFELRNGTSAGDRAHAVGGIYLGGSQREAFRVGPMPGSPFGFGRPLTLAPGEKIEWDVSLSPLVPTESPDGFGRIYQATLQAEWYDQYNGDLTDAAYSQEHGNVWGAGAQHTRTWELEHKIAGPLNDDRSKLLTSGINLRDQAILATSTRQTTAALLDSATLNREVNLRVQFRQGTAADAAQGVVGDIVSITGLGTKTDEQGNTLPGILHVLQVGYDPTVGAAGELRWFRADANAEGGGEWINAVLGNSNIKELDLEAGTLKVGTGTETTEIDTYLASMRHVGSYSSYLLGNELLSPKLGAWGFDADRNYAWAVIDHNSDFNAAAVPEPTTLALLGLVGTGLLVRRRRY